MKIKKLYRAGNAVRRRLRKLTQPEDANAAQPGSGASRSKLVMTLLARDEADVIEKNIEYHLRHGVDFFIATDNGSKDGTLEIFRKYAERGCLHLIEEPGLNMDQAAWVNRMGRLAFDQYGADMIIHADADEFWVASSGNLKYELLRKRYADCLKVPIWHAVLIDRNGAERFPDDMGYLVKPEPEILAGGQWKKFSSSYKVMFKTGRGLPLVNMGNHGLEDRTYRFDTEISTDVKVVHFGIRGKDHFYRKVKNGGAAIESNREYSPAVCIHWRQWYQLYQEGRLDEEYGRKTISENTLNGRLEDGSVIPVDLDFLFRN